MDASVEAARVRGIEPDSMLAVKRGHFPGEARAAHDRRRRPARPGRRLRRACPRCGRSWSRRIIETAARRNAVIAAAIWIPGADMPLLTAVEMRMVLHARRLLRRRGRRRPGGRAARPARRRLRPARGRARAARRRAGRGLGGEGRRRLLRHPRRSGGRRSSTSSAAPSPTSRSCARSPSASAPEPQRPGRDVAP